jgi:hypothetical protein
MLVSLFVAAGKWWSLVSGRAARVSRAMHVTEVQNRSSPKDPRAAKASSALRRPQASPLQRAPNCACGTSAAARAAAAGMPVAALTPPSRARPAPPVPPASSRATGTTSACPPRATPASPPTATPPPVAAFRRPSTCGPSAAAWAATARDTSAWTAGTPTTPAPPVGAPALGLLITQQWEAPTHCCPLSRPSGVPPLRQQA